jgi:hypothetical protein
MGGNPFPGSLDGRGGQSVKSTAFEYRTALSVNFTDSADFSENMGYDEGESCANVQSTGSFEPNATSKTPSERIPFFRVSELGLDGSTSICEKLHDRRKKCVNLFGCGGVFGAMRDPSRFPP